jgi:hypothetical protein
MVEDAMSGLVCSQPTPSGVYLRFGDAVLNTSTSVVAQQLSAEAWQPTMSFMFGGWLEGLTAEGDGTVAAWYRIGAMTANYALGTVTNTFILPGQSSNWTLLRVDAGTGLGSCPPPYQRICGSATCNNFVWLRTSEAPKSCYQLSWGPSGPDGSDGHKVIAIQDADGTPLYVCRAAWPDGTFWRFPGYTNPDQTGCWIVTQPQNTRHLMTDFEVLYTNTTLTWTR